MANMKKIKSRKIRGNVSSKKIEEDFKNFDDVLDETKKSEMVVSEGKKKVRARKIRMSLTAKEEKKIDKQMEVEEKVSVTVMVVLLLLCFVVGILLGYVLYKIAIDSSNVMFIVKYLFN